MKIGKFKIIGIAVVIIGVIVFGVFMWNSTQETYSGKYPPSANVDIAYKHINGKLYQVYDTAGYCYYVTEQKFQDYNVPQKIGDNLYRLPDGKLLTCLAK